MVPLEPQPTIVNHGPQILFLSVGKTEFLLAFCDESRKISNERNRRREFDFDEFCASDGLVAEEPQQKKSQHQSTTHRQDATSKRTTYMTKPNEPRFTSVLDGSEIHG
jgi:hypothetical protein